MEVRKIAASKEAVPHLDRPGAAQLARIERTRHIAYIVTSLTAAKAGPARLLALSRDLRVNRLHYVRDVSMDEDRCRVRAAARAGHAAPSHAHLIRAQGLSVPEARENLREDRAHAMPS